MSSRSLAAARARRSGESAPPVSGNRPITSIGSVAQHSNYPSMNSNVRTAKSMQQPSRQPPQSMKQPTYYDAAPQPPTNANSNGLPFSKLSISDAIGLITLRLGRVEQWMIDTDHEQQERGNNGGMNIPDNHKVIDASVLTTIVNRLDALEKNPKTAENPVGSEEVAKLSDEVKKVSEQLSKLSDDCIKRNLEMAKHSEQLLRFNREWTETKDILKSFMLKYDMFTQEITQTLAVYEEAIAEIEKKIPEPVMQASVPEPEQEPGTDSTEPALSGDDLKTIIQKELANSA